MSTRCRLGVDWRRRPSSRVVGHGSSETIRPSDVSVTPFESASEQWAGGDAAAGGWLTAMRAMAIEYQLATVAGGNGLLL